MQRPPESVHRGTTIPSAMDASAHMSEFCETLASRHRALDVVASRFYNSSIWVPEKQATELKRR
jgi:hypothetical protein